MIREDGFASILGRIKDVIVRGGENVYPKEVENAIEMHPDVMEAQVKFYRFYWEKRICYTNKIIC